MKKKVIIVVFLLISSWVGGFFYFLNISKSYVNDRSITDVIVVFSGGRLRIKTGVELLKAGYAPILFISGVEASDQLKKTLVMQGVRQEQIICAQGASTTKTSAHEVYEFVINHEIRSIRLVTAYYHMPRAMEEMQRIIPKKIRIIPYPVNFDDKSLSILFKEYSKFLLLKISEFFI